MFNARWLVGVVMVCAACSKSPTSPSVVATTSNQALADMPGASHGVQPRASGPATAPRPDSIRVIGPTTEAEAQGYSQPEFYWDVVVTQTPKAISGFRALAFHCGATGSTRPDDPCLDNPRRIEQIAGPTSYAIGESGVTRFRTPALYDGKTCGRRQFDIDTNDLENIFGFQRRQTADCPPLVVPPQCPAKWEALQGSVRRIAHPTPESMHVEFTVNPALTAPLTISFASYVAAPGAVEIWPGGPLFPQDRHWVNDVTYRPGESVLALMMLPPAPYYQADLFLCGSAPLRLEASSFNYWDARTLAWWIKDASGITGTGITH